MHDIKYIRENPQEFDAALARRGVEAVAQNILGLDEQSRALKTELQNGQARRNEASKAIGKAKGQGDEETAQALMAEVSELKKKLPALEEQERNISIQLKNVLASLPNLPDSQVPDGDDENDNVELERWGAPRTFDFEPKAHDDLGVALGMMDFETAAKMSGSRFVILSGHLSRLDRALSAFMLDLQTTKFGFEETTPPYLVWDKALFGTGQLPKFAEDSYSVDTEYTKVERAYKSLQRSYDQMDGDNRFFGELNQELGAFSKVKVEQGFDMTGLKPIFNKLSHYFGNNAKQFEAFSSEFAKLEKRLAEMQNQNLDHSHYLIPTAEVPLTNMVSNTILDGGLMPSRRVAHTPCFRSEAGSAGKDTKGMIRQHQFNKVELVSITTPEESDAEHRYMLNCAKEVLVQLGLPHRVIDLCAGDLGFGAKRTYDIEVWLPSQNTYREISSISNCGDFQARRMNARFRPEGEEKGTRFVHTLNGSGLAVGRTLVAVLENYQQADGSVTIPSALLPYMGGIDKLEPS